MTHRRILLASSLAILMASLPGPTLAADIGATVTVAAPCVTVGPAIDYGTHGFAPSGSVPSPASGNSTYANCGSSTEQIAVQGTDATSTTSGSNANWTLQSQQPCQGVTTPDAFRVEIKDYAGVSLALSSSTAQVIDPALAGSSGDQTLSTYLYMPCSGSSGAGETMQFTISVIAYF